MRKETLTIIFVFLALLSGYFYYLERQKAENEIVEMSKRVYKLQTEREVLEDSLKLWKLEARNADVLLALYKQRADSLGEHIKNLPKDTPCEHELALTQEHRDRVQLALEKCEEAKGIHVQVSKGYADLVINHEVSCPEEIKLAVKEEKKKGRIWKWVAGGGWLLVFLLVI